MCACQAATGSGSSSRTQCSTRLPQTVDVRLAEHLRRPPLVRHADHRPVAQPLGDLPRGLLRKLQHARLPDALAGQVAEELRLCIAGERDDRGALLAERALAREQPRWRPREDVVPGCRLDQRAPDVRVDVAHVDVAGAGAIGGTRDLAHDRRVLEPGEHLDQLARLDVGADADDQLRVALLALRCRHSGSCHTSSRRSGTTRPSRVTPSTSTSGPPIMKSVCMAETLIPSSGSTPS